MQHLQDNEQLLIRKGKAKNNKIFSKMTSPFYEQSSKDIDAGASISELPLTTSINILSHNEVNINWEEAGSLESKCLILLFVCLILTIRLFKSN